ncbi:hypothetical protein [Pedobacter sp. SYSU D00535]|uniref:hypothetical protein n=1 Tax=Pedobacter sp. SYSU D00535 TaxID=2810308 RepID=UPI001A97978E|nr:hypothetical protein [Pedobacter sp. SYSU D00535]
MKYFIIPVLVLITMSKANAQLNVQLLHQLVAENKSEFSRQQTARNRQGLVSAQEEVNRSKMEKLKGKYREIKERFHIATLLVSTAGIAPDAWPVVQDIYNSQDAILQKARDNPVLLPLALVVEEEMLGEAMLLLNFLYGLCLTVGDLNQMRPSDRNILFNHALSRLKRIAADSKGLEMALSKQGFRRSSSLPDLITQDRRLAGDIVERIK